MTTNNNTQARTAASNLAHPPLLLTITEAAARLSIGRSSAYELIASGQLEIVHIGRSARVPAAAIDDLVIDLRRRSTGQTS